MPNAFGENKKSRKMLFEANEEYKKRKNKNQKNGENCAVVETKSMRCDVISVSEHLFGAWVECLKQSLYHANTGAYF